ncbi:MAG: response regulator, partial [Casimicrobiaceae bacterium]
MRDALIIDDTAQEAIALGRMLAAGGWRSTTCGNGDIALAMLDYQPFDLVVADVVMEGMVGTALLDAIRSTPTRYFMPVVFVSAMPESRVRRIIDGDYMFLRKPFSRPELMAAVNQASLRS